MSELNRFGGKWTRMKIEILVEYAEAYLQIMKDRKYWKLLYFDGFAGTGFITHGRKQKSDLTIGAAKRIIEIDSPRSFDGYYFVELDPKKIEELKKNTKDAYQDKRDKIFICKEDCNVKLTDMSNHIKSNERKYDKVLAYIDPCGMQLNWSSLEALRGIDADVWILVPTGMGVTRLLTKSGDISDAWLKKLEFFLGLDRSEILPFSYDKKKVRTLFGEIERVQKKEQVNKMASELYQKRLKDVFKYVTNPLPLRNRKGWIMYHLIFVSNNKTAHKIASDILNKYKNHGTIIH